MAAEPIEFEDLRKSPEHADRMRAVARQDPLSVLAQRPWPTRTEPLRPDGSLDVTAWCAQLDAAANAATGAGEPRW